MSSLALLVLLTAAPAHYPLAAVFVDSGELVLSSMKEKRSTRLPTPGLMPVSGDVDRSLERVVFAARAAVDQPARLFLMDLRTKTVKALPTEVLGEHQAPRFGHDGKTVIFGAPDVFPGSPNHPTSTRVLTLASMVVTTTPRVDASKQQCEFGAAPLGAEALHVSTNCFLGFELRAKGTKGPSERAIAPLNSPAVEIATSFDEKRFVYTIIGSGGTTVFFVDKPGGAPRAILTLESEFSKIQPSFVCPRDVMLTTQGATWALNTETASFTRITSVAANADGGR